MRKLQRKIFPWPRRLYQIHILIAISVHSQSRHPVCRKIHPCNTANNHPNSWGGKLFIALFAFHCNIFAGVWSQWRVLFGVRFLLQIKQQFVVAVGWQRDREGEGEGARERQGMMRLCCDLVGEHCKPIPAKLLHHFYCTMCLFIE